MAEIVDVEDLRAGDVVHAEGGVLRIIHMVCWHDYDHDEIRWYSYPYYGGETWSSHVVPVDTQYELYQP